LAGNFVLRSLSSALLVFIVIVASLTALLVAIADSWMPYSLRSIVQFTSGSFIAEFAILWSFLSSVISSQFQLPAMPLFLQAPRSEL